MNSTGHIGPIPCKNASIGSPYDDNLSPAAREAKDIIPKNIVKEMAAKYGRQINRLIASENNAICSEARQNIAYQPSEETPEKNASFLKKKENCI